jgi:hypothetical protein
MCLIHKWEYKIEKRNESMAYDVAIRTCIRCFKKQKTNMGATEGWKVKIKYHETFGKNWFSNRGETNYFVKEVEVLDKDPMGSVFGNKSDNNTGGRVVDTVYVVIVPKEKVIK